MIPVFPLIGLGNPGADYRETRHNVGFWFADYVADQAGVWFKSPFLRPWTECICPISFFIPDATEGYLLIIKPLTFMNRSGDIIDAVWQRHEKNGWELQVPLIAVDQMDLPPGSIRLKSRGGTAGHNGLKSVYSYLGEEFLPLYIGVGRPPTGASVIDHVLGEPALEEKTLIKTALTTAAQSLPLWLKGNLEEAIAKINGANRAGS